MPQIKSPCVQNFSIGLIPPLELIQPSTKWVLGKCSGCHSKLISERWQKEEPKFSSWALQYILRWNTEYLDLTYGLLSINKHSTDIHFYIRINIQIHAFSIPWNIRLVIDWWYCIWIINTALTAIPINNILYI